MPVRETSKKVYKEINEEGKIGEQAQAILYYLIGSTCPLSLQEIKVGTKIDINAVSGRVNDLKKAGKVFEHAKRKCTITGRTITPVWHKEKTTLF